MRTRLMVLGAACLMTTGATAADLIIVDPPVYAPSLYDWNGFYAGINAGFGGGVFEHPLDVTSVPPLTGSADVTASGFLGGVQAGYNWQWDDGFLLGIEADIQGSTVDGRVSLSLAQGPNTIDIDLGTKLDWFATIRPRLGVVNDRFVVYATGGLAWGQTTSSINAAIVPGPAPFEESVKNDRFGWTVGAGIEYALTDTITFKTEYLYTDLGSEEILNLDLGGGTVATVDSDVAFHAVRAGINFQF